MTIHIANSKSANPRRIFLSFSLAVNVTRVDPRRRRRARRSSLTDDRPPNEFFFQHDQYLINLDEPVPLITDQRMEMNTSLELLETITTTVKRLFEIKRADKVRRERLSFDICNILI